MGYVNLADHIENLDKKTVADIRSSFGDYIIKRQSEENLRKPLQCYKDDYVKQCIQREMAVHAMIVIDTHASDLQLFNIGGQYV